jgi:hypothetical protein
MDNKSNEEPVYDPTQTQLEDWSRLSSADLPLSELCNPATVVLLIKSRRVNLIELKALKQEVVELRGTVDQLRTERENLRVRLGRSEDRGFISWIEIPISVISGFAVNMVTNDFTNWVGWALLIMTVGVLVSTRLHFAGKEKNNA